ncbi:c-type cytochrome [Roseovarius aestuarii]|nr:c-type cytochrome [Roseovarius aestuarii]
MKKCMVAMTALMLAGPVYADSAAADAMMAPSGDSAAGEAVFKKQCVACHVVVNDEGETLAGRRGRQGPNLYGIAMQHVSTVEGFKYSKPMMAASDLPDLRWNEANFAAFVQDPSGWLTEQLGEKSRSKMTHKVRKEQDALDVYAFIYSLAPPANE